MTTQEILTSLANLEKELQNIKSARILTEETITSYRDVQKEVKSLLDGLKHADDSILAVMEWVKSQNVSLSEIFKQKIGAVDVQLSGISKTFKESCDKSNADFTECISDAINDLRQKTIDLVAEYTSNNVSLKQAIGELAALHTSMAEMNTYTKINSINNKVTDFYAKFEEYRVKQSAAIEEIGQQIIINKEMQEKILSQLCNVLFSIQENELKNINKHLEIAEEKLHQIETLIFNDSKEFATLHTSIADADAKINSINNNAADFHAKFEEYRVKQSAAIKEIGQQIIINKDVQEKALSQIYNELLSIQEKQDNELKNTNEHHKIIEEKLQQIESLIYNDSDNRGSVFYFV